MIFEQTELKGAFLIKPERHTDDRGSFQRSFCRKEFAEHGLNNEIAQCNISHNKKKGTFRGMHFQAAPYAEDKIVTCTHGAIYDIIVDLRMDSPTFKRSIGVELNEENQFSLYVPQQFAHGFLSLADDSTVYYMMTEFYHPDSGRGFRWNDEAFDIQLPEKIRQISERDENYPDFELSLLEPMAD